MTTTLEATTHTATDLKSLATDVVRRAMQGGASAAECVVRKGDEFSTVVRLGQVETLKEAGSRSIGVRVFFGQRAASTHSSDFSSASIERIHHARRAEKAALDADPPIKNREGGSLDAARGHKILANSLGFVGDYRRSYCSVAAVPIAQDDAGNMQRDYWYSVARSLAKLDPAEQVGKEAARRTLRRLGARKAKTAYVPVVLDPMVATSMLEHIFEGINDDSVYRGASFLAGKLGEQIARANSTIIADGTIVGGFGTSPFDGQGI